MTDQRILDAIDELALELVAVTARALTEAVNDLDLTLSQWRVLVVIGQRRAPLRVGEIASRIDASLRPRAASCAAWNAVGSSPPGVTSATDARPWSGSRPRAPPRAER